LTNRVCHQFRYSFRAQDFGGSLLHLIGSDHFLPAKGTVIMLVQPIQNTICVEKMIARSSRHDKVVWFFMCSVWARHEPEKKMSTYIHGYEGTARIGACMYQHLP
jgi:hypothetical protein